MAIRLTTVRRNKTKENTTHMFHQIKICQYNLWGRQEQTLRGSSGRLTSQKANSFDDRSKSICAESCQNKPVLVHTCAVAEAATGINRSAPASDVTHILAPSSLVAAEAAVLEVMVTYQIMHLHGYQ